WLDGRGRPAAAADPAPAGGRVRLTSARHPVRAGAADPHHQRFHLEEFVHPVAADLAAQPRLLHAAESDLWEAVHPGVGPDRAGLRPPRELQAGVDVLAPYPGRKA